MDLKFLNSSTVKLTLTNKDMKKYKISYEILKKNEKITKNIILNILKDTKEFLTNKIEKNKITLESFKTKNNKNIFYINLPKNICEKTTNNSIQKKKVTTKIPVIAIFKKKTT